MRQAASWLACMFGGVMLVLAGLLLNMEREWVPRERLSPEQAFLYGDIGLELAPLKYLLVMDDPRLGGAAFSGGVETAEPGAWVRNFGFIARDDQGGSEMPCADRGRRALPFGFSLSHALPDSGWPFPVAFGGLACAACHSAEFEYQGTRKIVAGTGNPHLDIFAFGEAFKNAVQNPALSGDAIFDVYQERCGVPDGLAARSTEFLERRFLDIWLVLIREELGGSSEKYDLAHPAHALTDSSKLPAGPSRTRAFRSVLRVSLDLPGEANFSFSKLPSVFLQSTKLCGQFDGSICNQSVRSLIAAYSSGASITELARSDIVHNIRVAAEYALEVKPADRKASFADLFPDRAPGQDEDSRLSLIKGERVYDRECARCHGKPSGNGGRWTLPQPRPERPITPLSELGTDPVRIEFRHAARLPDAIWLAFPGAPGELRDLQRERLNAKIVAAAGASYGEEAALWRKLSVRYEAAARRYPLGHPFAFADKTLIYNSDPAKRGYQNNALPGLFLNAPYLHNGSVPNLAQLLHLEERPAQFCRGREPYDPDILGFRSPRPAGGRCPPEAPWLFDTARPGNGNGGHDYPFKRQEALLPENQAALRNLLVYLKTF